MQRCSAQARGLRVALGLGRAGPPPPSPGPDLGPGGARRWGRRGRAAGTAGEPALGEGSELTGLECSALAGGGAGLLRHDGLVVLTDYVFPGDSEVSVVVTKRQKRLVEAKLLAVGSPSPLRVQPPPSADLVQTVAPLAPLVYREQVREKQAQIDRLFRNLGNLPAVRPLLAAEEEYRYRYRNRMEFHAGGPGNRELGLHRKGSNFLVRVDGCMLQSEEADAIYRFIAQRLLLLPADQDITRLIVRKGRAEGRGDVYGVNFVAGGDVGVFEPLARQVTERFRSVVSIVHTRKVGRFRHRTTVLAGAAIIPDRLLECNFQLSPLAFFQPNTLQAEVMYELVRQFAAVKASDRCVDLFCGIGSIGLACLARDCKEVVGVEVVDEALAQAVVNARLNGLEEKVRFVKLDLFNPGGPRRWKDPAHPLHGVDGDVIVADPPRAGLKAMVPWLLQSSARRLVLVSCVSACRRAGTGRRTDQRKLKNPGTLARDLGLLTQPESEDGTRPFEIVAAQPLDMFPQTPHIECVVALER